MSRHIVRHPVAANHAAPCGEVQCCEDQDVGSPGDRKGHIEECAEHLLNSGREGVLTSSTASTSISIGAE